MEPTPPNPSQSSPPRAAGPGWLAAAGLLAAAVAWLITTQWYPFFQSGVTVGIYARPSDEEIAAITQADLFNCLALFGLLGGALGVAFAGAMALRRRSPWLAVAGVPSGLILGAAGGMLGGWCASAVADALVQSALVPHKYRGALNPTIARACGWCLIGLGAGLGFSLPLANLRVIGQAALGALIGGLIAAPCYQVVVAIVGMFAQIAGADDLIPVNGVTSAAWFATAAVVIGLAAGLAGSTSGRSKLESRS